MLAPDEGLLSSTEEACPYCKKLNHTLKQCWLKKSDENLKDEVNTLIPSLKKIYKGQHDLLQQKGKFTTDQGKMMKSILRTLQGMTIGGHTMETLMDTRVHHHQGETYKLPNQEIYTRSHTQKYEEDQDYQEHEGYTTEQDDGQDDDQQYESQNEEGEDDGQDDYEEEYELVTSRRRRT